MSNNYIANDSIKHDWIKINCESMKTNHLTVDNILSVNGSGSSFNDIEVKNDLQVNNNANISGTLTANTIISVDQIEVKDPLIGMGVGNTADNYNMGFYQEYKDGINKYSGIARSYGDKKFYFYNNSNIKPLINTDLSTLERANIVLNSADVKNISMQNGSGVEIYKLPTNTPSNGQYIKSIGGVNTEWSNIVIPPEPNFIKTQSTGILTGGILSINVDNTKFNISDGTGQIVDSTNGILYNVSWSGLTGLSHSYTGNLTYILLDASGIPYYRATKPSNTEHRNYIHIGVIVHTDGTHINAVNNEQSILHNSTSQIQDLIRAIGFLNISGNDLSCTSNNLTFAKSAGQIFYDGINYSNNINDPHLLSLPATNTATGNTFQYRYNNGSSSSLLLTNIIPNQYDIGLGISNPGVVPSNRFTVQRFYIFTSNAIKVQPGQTLYSTLEEALSLFNSENFIVEQSINENGLLIGFLAIKGNCTNLNDPLQAKFIKANKFGSSGGGISTTYDQSLNTTDNVIFNSVTTNTINPSSALLTIANTQNVNISETSKITTIKGLTKAEGGIIISDNKHLQLSDTTSLNLSNIRLLFLSAGAIPYGSVCKIINSGGVARIDTVKALDTDDVPIVGIATNSTSIAGQQIGICIGGIFECIVSNTITINIGDLIEKSDTQDGRVTNFIASQGSFAIALTSGTGNVAGTVLIKAIFKKSESF